MKRSRRQVDLVRLFGLSGVALETELGQVELEFDINLHGRSGKPPSERGDIYYPQFEEAVRREASTMSRHYEIFYCLEKSIRTLIEQRLAESSGADWWTKKVQPVLPAIARDAEDRMQKEIDSGVTLRSPKPIDFTNFGELGEIIKSNWDIFGDTFSSKKAVEK